MICAQHNHWNAGAECPKCAEAKLPDLPLDGLVVVNSPPPILDLPPVVVGDGLDIPLWLRRAPDGSVWCPCYPIDPTASAEVRKAEHAADEGIPLTRELTLEERQPIYKAMHAAEERKKMLARIAKLKEQQEGKA